MLLLVKEGMELMVQEKIFDFEVQLWTGHLSYMAKNLLFLQK